MNLNHLSSDYISETPEAETPAARDLFCLRRVAVGDEDALSELYQKYSSPLYVYVVRLILDSHVAEDLIQEVFIAVWRSAKRFRGQSSVRTWLFKIAHYQAVSWLRRHVQPGRNTEIDLTEVPDPENLAMDNWLKKQVGEALAKLSPEHRAVVELTFYHGLSYIEIAEIMDCPVGTVKSRMSYARRYLNESLKSIHMENRDLEL